MRGVLAPSSTLPTMESSENPVDCLVDNPSLVSGLFQNLGLLLLAAELDSQTKIASAAATPATNSTKLLQTLLAQQQQQQLDQLVQLQQLQSAANPLLSLQHLQNLNTASPLHQLQSLQLQQQQLQLQQLQLQQLQKQSEALAEKEANLGRPPTLIRKDYLASNNNNNSNPKGSAWNSTLLAKRKRKQSIIWTKELHSEFLNALVSLGDEHARPKAILEAMRVKLPGIQLTRDMVASHLQRYRKGYIKSNADLPDAGFDKSPSPSESE